MNYNAPTPMIVRGRASLVETNKSSLELFRDMKPSLTCTRINDILADMIYISVKDTCFSAVSFNSKFNRFDPVSISAMITKYVSIYIDTSDKNVLKILYNILIDTFLNCDERNDSDLTNFFNSIYNNVMALLP